MTTTTIDLLAQTPWEKRGAVWVKRDDLFTVGDTCGGKARTTLRLIRQHSAGEGVVTAGLRKSSQLTVIAEVARWCDLACRIHIPDGPDTDETRYAEDRGAELVRHRPGYGTVVAARARTDAADRNWVHVPYQMQCRATLHATAGQVDASSWPSVQRLVVPVGSGMTLSGILHGLIGWPSPPRARGMTVLGVVCGAPADKTLDKWAPSDWRDHVTLVPTPTGYGPTDGPTHIDDGLALDAVYEAKCLPYMRPEDGLWVVGRSIHTPIEGAP